MEIIYGKHDFRTTLSPVYIQHHAYIQVYVSHSFSIHDENISSKYIFKMYVYFNITILPTKFVLLSICVWPLIWASPMLLLVLFFSVDYFPFLSYSLFSLGSCVEFLCCCCCHHRRRRRRRYRRLFFSGSLAKISLNIFC